MGIGTVVAGQSKIEWTTATWNPVTGCSKVSAGCENCYAAAMARRLKAMGLEKYRNGFDVTTHECVLDVPLGWRKPRLVFVNSMSDLFHEEVPLRFIRRVFDVMKRADRHVFQVLTKRSGRLLELRNDLEWPPNVWIGVTVESADYGHRLEHLRQIEASTRFVSFEPLLSDVGGVDLDRIDWVIAGGESGPRARPMRADWVRHLRDVCQRSEIPFFFKQWGGFRKKARGRELDGRTWDEMPAMDGVEASAF